MPRSLCRRYLMSVNLNLSLNQWSPIHLLLSSCLFLPACSQDEKWAPMLLPSFPPLGWLMQHFVYILDTIMMLSVMLEIYDVIVYVSVSQYSYQR